MKKSVSIILILSILLIPLKLYAEEIEEIDTNSIDNIENVRTTNIGNGIVEEGENKYIYINNELQKGLIEYENKKYYADEEGRLIKGFKKIGEELYFFSAVNNATKTGWL